MFVCTKQKPDGSYNMPDTSIVLQGSTVQMTGRDQNTFDIILVSRTRYRPNVFTYRAHCPDVYSAIILRSLLNHL